MNKVIAFSLAAVLASSSAVLAQQDGERGNSGGNAPTAGKPNGDSPSARDQAPGQKKEPGTSAREEAPGQTKDRGTSARDDAPGQNKDASEQTKTDRNDRTDKGDVGEDRKADRDMKDGQRDGAKADRTDDKNDDANTKSAGRDVSPEQKTKVKTVFKNHRVDPARNINFSLNVGVKVPREVRFYSMPQDIVVIVPQYRDYRYFLVDDKVVIVDPDTYEIVDIIIIA